MPQSVGSLLVNILAGLVLIFLEKWLLPKLDRGNPLYRRYRLPFIGILWLIANLIYAHFLSESAPIFLIVTSAIISWIIYRELNQFWCLGVVGADRETRLGINHEKALNLCTSSMDFLGIGGGKLRAYQSAFEAAIDRCSRPDRSIRFLLCRPNNEGLKRIAQSAGRDELSYQKVVQESLRMIAHLKNERAKNIQVRLYQDFPVFRLMFINDAICLASHYVLGKGGDGSEAPQLHIVKASKSRDVESLYYAFSSYYERLWQESEIWDFQSYV